MGGAAPGALRLLRLAVMASLAWVAIAAEVAPAAGSTRTVPAPDLLLGLFAAAAIRGPAAAPALLVFGAGVLRDLLTGAPPGLGAVGLIAGVEVLKRAGASLRRRRFGLEWAAVAGAGAAAVAAQALLLGLTLYPPPPLGDLALRAGMTALAYPVAALAARLALRLGPRAAVAEGELMFGRRA
jgi:hypothetical protein